MATPPSLSRSCGLESAALPVPIKTSRVTLSPAGATISSALPLLPVNRSAFAARATGSAAAPNTDRVRGADLVLWRREALPPRPLPDLIPVPPELVVEVRRPFDTIPDMIRKAAE